MPKFGCAEGLIKKDCQLFIDRKLALEIPFAAQYHRNLNLACPNAKQQLVSVDPEAVNWPKRLRTVEFLYPSALPFVSTALGLPDKDWSFFK